MSFPEFDPTKRKLLFFSRGRGRGHARPDIEIVKELTSMRPDIEVRFVSYGTGADTIAEFELPLIDIQMPEYGPTAEISVAAGRLIRWLNPDLIVSHEEFAAAPAAKVFEKPCVFITDFFAESDLYSMHALQFADQVLFLGAPGVFPEPEWVEGKVRYLGPVAKPSRFGGARDGKARKELEIPNHSFVLGVFPGSWTQYGREFAEMVVRAYDDFRAPVKTLLWAAGPDHEEIATLLNARPDAHVFHRCWDMDRLMSACDVAITRGNRMSTVELVSRGVPVIAISFGLNPTDDTAMAGLPGVTIAGYANAGKGGLLHHIENARAPQLDVPFATFADCASAISGHLPPGFKREAHPPKT